MRSTKTHTRSVRENRRKRNILFDILLASGLALLGIAVFGYIIGRGISAVSGDLPFISALNLDESESVVADTSDSLWYLALVNRWNPIPEDYKINLVDVPGGEQVDERIYAPLMQMLEDAEKEGLGPTVVSGYRTQKKQQKLYDDKINEYRRQGYSTDEATAMAQEWVAVPGTSEHQLGLAVDINGATYDIYLWLQENSYKYGFIFRYPGNKTDITGTAEEVWHYRYVGEAAAAEIYEQGICLEEYLEQ